jgi:hypothetical protein
MGGVGVAVKPRDTIYISLKYLANDFRFYIS